MVGVDGVPVDLVVGLDAANKVGKDRFVEEFHAGLGVDQPVGVQGVGVGEEDEPETALPGGPQGVPHGRIGHEDGIPCFAEPLVGAGESELCAGPGDIVLGVDLAGLEVVLAFEEALDPLEAVGGVVGDEAHEAGLEVESEEDVADVDEGGGGGVHEGVLRRVSRRKRAAVAEALGRAWRPSWRFCRRQRAA